jgi:hypothetical protein
MRRDDHWIDDLLSGNAWLAVFVMIAVLVACVALVAVR